MVNITEQEWLLAEKRFEALSEDIKLTILPLGVFTKDEILEHIMARDEIGIKIVEPELNYFKWLKQRGQ